MDRFGRHFNFKNDPFSDYWRINEKKTTHDSYKTWHFNLQVFNIVYTHHNFFDSTLVIYTLTIMDAIVLSSSGILDSNHKKKHTLPL